MGITLSGGLDSRAIIAAVPRPGADIAAVTFGIPGSPDVRIARRVARLKGARHSIVELGPHDWLQLRPEAVWWTDGQVDLCQLHGMEALDEMRRGARIFLNGMDGGAILGAGYLLHESYLDNVDRALIAATLGCSESCLSNFSLYEGLGKPDFYILENTTRRKTNEGLRMSGNAVECRVPFFDNALLEFAYSLPDASPQVPGIFQDHTLVENRSARKHPAEGYQRLPACPEAVGICLGAPRESGRYRPESAFLRGLRGMDEEGAGLVLPQGPSVVGGASVCRIRIA